MSVYDALRDHLKQIAFVTPKLGEFDLQQWA